jgi:hypothetical protein
MCDFIDLSFSLLLAQNFFSFEEMAWRELAHLPLSTDLLYLIRDYWGLHSFVWLDEGNAEYWTRDLTAWFKAIDDELPWNPEYVSSALHYLNASKWLVQHYTEYEEYEGTSALQQLLASSMSLSSPAIAMQIMQIRRPQHVKDVKDVQDSSFEGTQWQYGFVSLFLPDQGLLQNDFARQLIQRNNWKTFLALRPIVASLRRHSMWSSIAGARLSFVLQIYRYVVRTSSERLNLLEGLLTLRASRRKTARVKWVESMMGVDFCQQFFRSREAWPIIVRSNDVEFAKTFIPWDTLRVSQKVRLLKVAFATVLGGYRSKDSDHMLEYVMTHQDHFPDTFPFMKQQLILCVRHPLLLKVVEKSPEISVYMTPNALPHTLLPSSPRCLDEILSKLSSALREEVGDIWRTDPRMRRKEFTKMWTKHGFSVNESDDSNGESKTKKRKRVLF